MIGLFNTRLICLIAIQGVTSVIAQDFVREIQPIFAEHCVRCHGSKKQRGNLRLDHAKSAFGKGDSGKNAIIASNASASEIIRRLSSDDPDIQMPPKGERVSAENIDRIEQWISAGADWPASANAPVNAAAGEMHVTESDRDHWAFRPLGTAPPPSLTDPWISNPIDQFVLNRLRAAGLEPNQRASAQVLARRMSFDVTGLPPSEDQTIDIDRLLDDSSFGERWARHWLDVVRYADSQGYEGDRDEPHAYQYRDFVIRSFNNDLPFDTFVRWQLAGDELAPEDSDAMTATGFLAIGPKATSAPTAPDPVIKKIRYDQLDDVVGTTGQAFLGLTLACARCHDHKFDPIPTRDYYQLVAAFANIERGNSPPLSPLRALDQWTKRSKARLLAEKLAVMVCTDDERKWLAAGPKAPAESKAAFRTYGKQLEFSEDEWRAWLSDDERQRLREIEAKAQASENTTGWEAIPALHVVDKSAKPVPVPLLRRGDVTLPDGIVDLGFLTVLTGERSAEDYLEKLPSSTGRRAAVAKWLADSEHGAGHLLARVMVNRIWQGYFSEGLVGTSNDFGLQGDEPSHPMLLDWLAGKLIRNEWKLKSIHRLILNSSTYQQSSAFDPDKHRLEPANKLLWRRLSKRLDAESIRDAILTVSGRLNTAMYGPGIRPFIPTAAMATRSKDKWPTDVVEGPEHWRRSLYIFVKRSIRFPMMEAFDAPDPTASCGRRIPTTVPVQALTMLNNQSIRGAAKSFAERIRANKDPIGQAYRRALGRQPDAEERRQAEAFLSENDEGDALCDLAHVLFTLNEFVYID